MSHHSVREFFEALARDHDMAQRYTTLTRRWLLGYSRGRVVAFAAQAGFHFTETELEYVRLTNYESQSLGRRCFYDKLDLEPTAKPHSPEGPHSFHKEHGRDPG